MATTDHRIDEKHATAEHATPSPNHRVSLVSKDGHLVNASGHRDQLQRQYGLLSICGLALTIDNAWVAFGGSLSVGVLNGGPPGLLYEFTLACAYYFLIALSISELASSVPSSGGVYHWASVTPGARWGRVIGFWAGSLNFFGWMFDLAAIAYIPANILVEMYAAFHPAYVSAPWHAYLAFVLVVWLSTLFIIFFNRAIPLLQTTGLFLILAGGLVTIIVCAAMPAAHASHAFVWRDFANRTGWPDGVAFLTGVLNGAFAIGTPDSVTHLAEELPNPRVDLPKAILAQVTLGFISAFVWAVAIFYSIRDLDAVTASFPLAEVYRQATGSAAGTVGLLGIVLLSIMICAVSTVLMVGRLWWTLARDNATPFAAFFSRVNERLSCPVEATVFTAVITTAFGAIQLGSATAFSSLVGSFIILTSSSYFLAIFSHILTGRSTVPRGPFWLGKWGYPINIISCVLIVIFNVFFCFPYAYPVTPIDLMNWNSVILAGIVALTGLWWMIHGVNKYPGPKLAGLYVDN